MGDEREEDAATATGAQVTAAAPASDVRQAGAGQLAEADAAPARDAGARAADGLVRAKEPIEEGLTPLARCRISLLKNVRYHEDREAHFSWINKALDLFVLVSGLGTVIALSDLLPTYLQIDGRWIAALTSVVGAVQLVFGLTRREALHADLRRRFLALLAELEEDNVKQTAARMRALFGDEPPTFHAADALAYNAAQIALGRPKTTLRVVTDGQRLWRNWRRFEGARFPEVAEIETEAKGG